MKMQLQIKNNQIDINYNDNACCWQTNVLLDKRNVEIEIDLQFHKHANVDWEHFSEFVMFIDKPNLLDEMIKGSLPLISELGKAFYRDSQRAINNWKMHFRDSIYYKGPGELNNSSYCYALLFDYFETNNNVTEGDAYGLYMVDIENLNIVGARRIQC
jgi:hypothetical protein